MSKIRSTISRLRPKVTTAHRRLIQFRLDRRRWAIGQAAGPSTSGTARQRTFRLSNSLVFLQQCPANRGGLHRAGVSVSEIRDNFAQFLTRLIAKGAPQIEKAVLV